MRERVQKIIAQSGLCSRRKAEDLIQEGKVTVNGVRITIGDKADWNTDEIKVDGTVLVREDKVYYMLNKPKRYITTSSDLFNRKTVLELVPRKKRVFSVGRLDRDATGLLLLTNDGEFANKITHPKYEVQKTYIAVLDKPFEKKDLNKIQKGILIDKHLVKAKAVILEKSTVAITLHVGLNKVVKRIFKELGYYVRTLHRTHIGNVAVDISQGSYRELKAEEMKKLFEKPNITKKTFFEEE